MTKKYVVLTDDDLRTLQRLLDKERNRNVNTRNRPAVPEAIPSATGTYAALVPESGIGGMLGLFPSAAYCDIYRLEEGELRPAGLLQPVYNTSILPVEGGSVVLVHRDKYGTWYASGAATKEGFDTGTGTDWEKGVSIFAGTDSLIMLGTPDEPAAPIQVFQDDTVTVEPGATVTVQAAVPGQPGLGTVGFTFTAGATGVPVVDAPAAPQFIANLSLTGTIDGSNAVFTSAVVPSTQTSTQSALSSVGSTPGASLYRNGIVQVPGADYTLSGSTFTFLSGSVPQTGDVLRLSTWAELTLTYGKLTSASNPSVDGDAVLITFVAAAPGGGTPTGTVELFDGGVSLGSIALSAGVALFTPTFAEGVHGLSAVLTASLPFYGCTAELMQTVLAASGTDDSGTNYSCGHPTMRVRPEYTLSAGAPTATLTIANVAAEEGDLILAWYAYDNSGATSAMWRGSRFMFISGVTASYTGAGHTRYLSLCWYEVAHGDGGTGDVVIATSGSNSDYGAVVGVFRNGNNGGYGNTGDGAASGTGSVASISPSGANCNLGLGVVIDDGSVTGSWANGFHRSARFQASASICIDLAWVQLTGAASNTPELDYAASQHWGIFGQYFST